jgi:hypothetical protein
VGLLQASPIPNSLIAYPLCTKASPQKEKRWGAFLRLKKLIMHNHYCHELSQQKKIKGLYVDTVLFDMDGVIC